MNAHLLKELAEAEHCVALGDRHIARQIEIVGTLESAGHSTELALSILENFQLAQAIHLARRDAIRKALSPAGVKGRSAQAG